MTSAALDWSRFSVVGDVFRLNAVTHGDKPALIDASGGVTSFAQLDERINRLCNALTARGVAKGARVAILSRNRPEYVEAYGTCKAGFVGVPLNWRLAPAELERLLRHSGAEVVIADRHFAAIVDRWSAGLPALAHCVALDEPAPGWLGYEDVLAEAGAQAPAVEVRPDDIVYLMYTSGTTGLPKGVATTHAAALDNADVTARDMLDLRPHDVSLVAMPLFHVGGMWFHCFVSVACGCTTVVLPEFESGAVLRALQRHHISNVHLVPTMVGALVHNPAVGGVDLSDLRRVFYAASSMPADLLRRAMATLSGARFAQGYGSTEAGVLTALLPADHLRAVQPGQGRLLKSCGKPFSGRAIRLVDDGGEDVAQGEIGEIVVRHAGLMQKYWNAPEATAKAMAGGWFHTGDLGWRDDEGYLYIVDRKNDLIITGGENVYPTEVEQLLYGHPAVLEAAVFGVPDPRWVERVVAAVVLRPGEAASADELIAAVRGELAAYKTPKEVVFVASLPKSAVGKILRKDLRASYACQESQP